MSSRRQKLRKALILTFLFLPMFFNLSPLFALFAASQGIVNVSLICFAFLFLSAPALGRAFCGWVCPAAGAREALFVVNDRPAKKSDWMEWIIRLSWISSVLFLAHQAGSCRRTDFFLQTTYGLSTCALQCLIAYLAVVLLLILLPALTVGRRSFRHYLCRMASFMVIGRRLSRWVRLSGLRLQAIAENRTRCSRCTEQCPMSLPVEDMVLADKMENSECILCVICMDTCRKKAVKFSWI